MPSSTSKLPTSKLSTAAMHPTPPSLSQPQEEALDPGEGKISTAAASNPRLAKFFSGAGLGKGRKENIKSSLPSSAASPTPPLFSPPPEAPSAGAAPPPPKPLKPKRHPMTLRDFAWSRMDTRRNLIVVNTLLRLRGPRPLSAEAVAAAVERRLLPKFPRFGQRARPGPRGPHWSDDDAGGFKLSDHIRVEREGEKEEEEESESLFSSSLEDRVARLASVPLDRRRPLWELIIMSPPSQEEEEEKKGGRGGDAATTTFLLFRVHHCITDGIGLMSVLEHLTADEEGGEEEASGEEGAVAAATAVATTTEATMATPQSPPLLLQPRSRSSPSPSPFVVFFRTLGNAVRLSFAWPHGPFPKNAFRAPAPLSGLKRFAWAPPLELERLRAVAKRNGVTVNDLFLAAAAAALRRYFSLGEGNGNGDDDDDKKKKNKKKEGDRVRAFVTFSLRDEEKNPAAKLGNEFGLVAVDLPTHLECPRERLEESSRRMTRLKGSREPHGVAALLSLAGLAPGKKVQGYFLKVSSFFFSLSLSPFLLSFSNLLPA